MIQDDYYTNKYTTATTDTAAQCAYAKVPHAVEVHPEGFKLLLAFRQVEAEEEDEEEQQQQQQEEEEEEEQEEEELEEREEQ